MKWLRTRPRDMNELNERRNHVEVYGDPDENEEEAARINEINGTHASQRADAATLAGRKKASARSRRRGNVGEGMSIANGTPLAGEGG